MFREKGLCDVSQQTKVMKEFWRKLGSYNEAIVMLSKKGFRWDPEGNNESMLSVFFSFHVMTLSNSKAFYIHASLESRIAVK